MLSHTRTCGLCAHQLEKGIVQEKSARKQKCLQTKSQQEGGRGLKVNGNVHKALCDGMRQVRGELRGLSPASKTCFRVQKVEELEKARLFIEKWGKGAGYYQRHLE